MMQPDDELCLCFHVTQRKVVNFLRIEKPQRVGQLSDCFGAGTGCGWCIPFLLKIADDPDHFSLNGMTPEEYAEKRKVYRTTGQPKNTFESTEDEG